MTSKTATEIPAPRTTTALPGARQRRWTLRQMLRAPVRDLLAVRGRGNALVLGCGRGELTRYLLELGFQRALGADSRPQMIAAAEAMRAEYALPEARLGFRAMDELPTAQCFDLVLVEAPEGTGASEADALARARNLTDGVCAIVSDSRLISRDLARDAGFASVSLIQPPTDAERSFVLLERVLLIARPGEASNDG